MNSYQELSLLFETRFKRRHFPAEPEKLYDASQYLLTLGGKRIRPVMCLMGNQMFNEIKEDAYHVATAIELFHNFTLVHDDIMDRAPLRRGMPTVHTKFGESTALLAGDVMLVAGYENLNKVDIGLLPRVLALFNKTAREVCEGQQLDMDFEKSEKIDFDDYVKMITLKTSVALAASLKLGAILGGAGLGNQDHLFEFGKTLVLLSRCRMITWMPSAILKNLAKRVGAISWQIKKHFYCCRRSKLPRRIKRKNYFV